MPTGKPSPKVIFAQQKKGRVLASIAAEHVGVHRCTIYSWIKNGDVRNDVDKSRSSRRGFLFVNLADCERMAGVR